MDIKRISRTISKLSVPMIIFVCHGHLAAENAPSNKIYIVPAEESVNKIGIGLSIGIGQNNSKLYSQQNELLPPGAKNSGNFGILADVQILRLPRIPVVGDALGSKLFFDVQGQVYYDTYYGLIIQATPMLAYWQNDSWANTGFYTGVGIANQIKTGVNAYYPTFVIGGCYWGFFLEIHQSFAHFGKITLNSDLYNPLLKLGYLIHF